MARKRRTSGTAGGELPGPSTNPATNLLMADIAVRTGTYVVRRLAERGFLRNKFDADTAAQIQSGRSLPKTIAAMAVSKVASRSVPGAVIVGGGLLAKTLFDRSQKKRKARRKGEEALTKRVED